MGAYLSEPITDKISHDEVGKRVACGACSMQGWRVTQEDAHNCLLEFDKATSLFAVYDGHGGHEVAQYCAQSFPEYIKQRETFQKGDYIQALKESFLGFDETLATPEVVTVLKRIADSKDGEKTATDEEPNADDDDDEEEENVKNLYEEAEMPLEEVIAKYQNDLSHPEKKLLQIDSKKTLFPSPRIRFKRSCREIKDDIWLAMNSQPGCSGMSKLNGNEAEPEVSSSSNNRGEGDCVTKDEQQITQSSDSTTRNGKKEEEASGTRPESSVPDEIMPDSSEDTTKQAPAASSVSTDSVNEPEVNGETLPDSKGTADDGSGDHVTSSSTPRENGEATDEKGKSKISLISSSADKKHNALTAAALYQSWLRAPSDSEDDDDDDEGDESFEGQDESEDGDEDEVAGKEEEEGDEDEEEDDEEEEEEEEDLSMKVMEEPGADSGCTAVVALLKDQELYVANAGDSRCVVCRKGEAIEMSLDHKPEDDVEMERIVKAGGKVTGDGRVNGGLNLSRALGDHAYKQSENLPAEEQMITALPDVRTLMINPDEDEFMILACDGIWNSLSSQEVVDFVRPRIQEGHLKLSQICAELFDHCLAPNTLGDGTGCDNMTAVIVQFLPALSSTETKNLKRVALPIENCTEDASVKRSKTEESDLSV